MDILVKHNGTNITNRVISYNREHRICTSIGTLEITLDGTYSTSIDPWDTIDIYENGDFKVRYYVSSTSKNVPDNIIVLECQDKSKRLVDYFIPDTYTIDYPSYTGYWIKKFLTEAGISYSITTGSEGNLLSNYTSLGLQPAYDQIMMLLQLSGWYMYFDGNGIAVIGSLDIDLSTTTGTVGLTDIVEIKRITNDDMLRNRAVVWGQFDSLRQEYAYADVRTHTRWNYDHDDLRTMVVSNSNIPNLNSAFGIANMLLKEFSKITVEKHITVTGARNYNLGNSIRVNSHIWRGKGLITTFGVSMDRSGLVTNIILDERCPRLFGFFDFGDYVYVGTFGDGIWRKHVKFDPAWYDFSSGLLDMCITDLYINNGMYGSISHSGHMYLAGSEEGPWYHIEITGLLSSIEDVVESGIDTQYTGYSGIMGRATVIDKATNVVKFGVDTSTRLNYGDYFIDYSGYFSTTGSGASSRGWIVEFDTFSGIVDYYPIYYSGNYNTMVIDLENDGVNDYVSIKSGFGEVVISGIDALQEYNYGTNPDYDDTAKVSLSNLEDNPAITASINVSETTSYYKHFMADNVDDHEYVYVRRDTLADNVVIFRTTYFANNIDFGQDTVQTLNSALLKAHDSYVPGHSSEILRTQPNRYERYLFPGISFGIADEGKTYTIYRHILLTNEVTMTDSVEEITLSIPEDVDFTPPSFPYDKAGTCTPYYFDDFMVLVWTWSESYISTYYVNTKIWFQVLRYGGTLETAELVYEKELGGAYVELFPHYDTFQSIGYVWNTAMTEWRTLYGIESIAVGEKFSYSYTGTTSYKLSSNISAISGNGIINYGVNGIDANQSLASGRIVYVKSVDGKVFRTTIDSLYPTDAKLQVNTTKLGSWVNINLGEYFPASDVFQIADSITNNIYVFGKKEVGSVSYLISINLDSLSVEKATLFSHYAFIPSGKSVAVRNVGNMVLRTWQTGMASTIMNSHFDMVENLNAPLVSPGLGFLVLQREGYDFNLIQRSNKPIRVDISNNSPVLTVRDFENTFQSNFVYGDSLEQIIPLSGLGMDMVRDYRYTMLETASGVVMSGIGTTSQVLYVTNSGVYISDLATYSGGFVLFESSPSGLLERVETSNYVYPGQYIFATTSGENPIFYQRDNDGLFFDVYTGLPDSRATIIRLDDRF